MNAQKTGLKIIPPPKFVISDSKKPAHLTGSLPVWVSPRLGKPASTFIRESLARVLKPVRTRSFGAAHFGSGPDIRIGVKEDGQPFHVLSTRHSERLPKKKLGKEGYILAISKEGVRIAVEDQAGAFNAFQTLKQILRKRGSGWQAPAQIIADAPAYPFRGVHLSGDGAGAGPEMERFIAEVLPRYKVNTLVLNVGYNFHFKKHPEIKSASPFTQKQARDIRRWCRDSNIHLIPHVNCLGHQSWRTQTIHGLLRAYPEFNETPGEPDPKYCYSWCPSNRKVYKVVNDLLDEIIEAFESDTIHLGMDEVFDLGVCPRCKGKKPSELFAKALNDLYRHVTKKHGVKVMVWGDRLINGKKTPYNEMNGARNGTHAALFNVPKDVFLCDWHYHLHDSYPSVNRFNRAGFDYVSCSYKKPWAVDAFMAYAARHGGRHYQGHLDTNWGSKDVIKNLLKGRAGVNDAADSFRRGMVLAWRGTQGVEPITKKQEKKYLKTRGEETELY